MEPLGASIFFAFDGINALSVFHPKDMVESWTAAAAELEAAVVESWTAAAAELEAAAELRESGMLRAPGVDRDQAARAMPASAPDTPSLAPTPQFLGTPGPYPRLRLSAS